MNLVHRRPKVFRQQFRKIPKGRRYFLATTLVAQPSSKVGDTKRIGGITTGSNGALTVLTVDGTAECVRLPDFLLLQS